MRNAHTSSPTARLRGFVLIAACAALSLCSGCQQIFAFMVASFAKPPKVEAQFKPPPNRKVLVFVDDYLQPVESPMVKSKLTESLGVELVDHEIAAEVVNYQDLLRFRGVTRNFRELGVEEIGRRLGAEWVLHVDIRQFQLREDPSSPLWQGKLTACVRVLDSEDGLLWPTLTMDGQQVEVETPAATHASAVYDQQLTEQLAILMADRVAKLFYDHREGD